MHIPSTQKALGLMLNVAGQCTEVRGQTMADVGLSTFYACATGS